MKCRQTLKAMVDILRESPPQAGGDEVCSVVSSFLGGARVYFVDSSGRIAGDSAVTADPNHRQEPVEGAELQVEAEAEPGTATGTGARRDEWRSGNTLAPRTVASLRAAAAGNSGVAQLALDGEWYAVAPVTVLQRTLGLVVARLTHEPSRDDLETLAPIAIAAGAVLAVGYQSEEDERERSQCAARSAIQSLSYSEIIAARAILDSLDDDQGFLVASRIADNAGMTRSVVVNALRKLSSANLVRTRSLGMKGTFVKLLNPELRTELEGTGIGREALPGQRSTDVPVPRGAAAAARKGNPSVYHGSVHA
ncbi:MAG: hypothetical protein ACM309_01680 [Bacillota bacterium]